MFGHPYVDAAVIAVIGTAVIALWRFVGRSLRRELHSVIEEIVNPELARIHERIDAHMESEEGDLRRLIDVLAELAGEERDTIRERVTGK